MGIQKQEFADGVIVETNDLNRGLTHAVSTVESLAKTLPSGVLQGLQISPAVLSANAETTDIVFTAGSALTTIGEVIDVPVGLTLSASAVDGYFGSPGQEVWLYKLSEDNTITMPNVVGQSQKVSWQDVYTIKIYINEDAINADPNVSATTPKVRLGTIAQYGPDGITASTTTADFQYNFSTGILTHTDEVIGVHYTGPQITRAAIVNEAVDESKLATNSVTTTKIADGNVTRAKLSPSVQANFTPLGTIVSFAGSVENLANIPVGWAPCDGNSTTYRIAEYRSLALILGGLWGNTGTQQVLQTFQTDLTSLQATSDTLYAEYLVAKSASDAAWRAYDAAPNGTGLFDNPTIRFEKARLLAVYEAAAATTASALSAYNTAYNELITADTSYTQLVTVAYNSEFIKLPDLRGYFLRGYDPTHLVDVDATRTLSGIQEDMVGPHIHSINTGDSNTGAAVDDQNDGQTPVRTRDTNLNSGTETRPINIAVNYLIYVGLPDNIS